jgi:hypothetical protein
VNYEANARHWATGDLVLHDGDRKEARMLMRVEGYTDDGLVRTRYIHPEMTRRVWTNRAAVLHDPARFGVSLPE